MPSPKKPGMFEGFRNRSSSDASKKKASAFMASMRSAMLVSAKNKTAFFFVAQFFDLINFF